MDMKKDISNNDEKSTTDKKPHLFSSKKRDAAEFAMLMQQAKTQHEMQSIVAKMQEFETVKNEQKAAVSNLERELTEGVTAEDVANREKSSHSLESQAISYEGTSQSTSQNSFTAPSASDLYKHEDIYKGDEYISSSDDSQNANKRDDNPNLNRDDFKSDIDKMLEKNTSMYKR